MLDPARAAPRELIPDSDVLAALTETIDAALDLRPLDPATTVFPPDRLLRLKSEIVAAANTHITDKLPWLGPDARPALRYGDDGIAPPAVVNAISLLSLETTAPPLLRAGIWPIHPFTHPAMIRLGEQLPLAWREFKNLQRRQLAALGLSDDVCNPIERESFVWLVEHSLKTYGTPCSTRCSPKAPRSSTPTSSTRTG